MKVKHSKQSRILHINKAYFPDVGGVETVCRQYVNVSATCFDDIWVLTLSERWGLGWHEENVNGVKVRRCKWVFRVGGHKFSLTFLWQLLLNAKSFSVIHGHDPFPLATLALLFINVKCLVMTYHSDIVRQGILKVPVDYLRLRVLNKASQITVTSKRLLDKSDVLTKLDCKRISVLHLYLDHPEKYSTLIAPETVSDLVSWVGTEKRPVLLMLGRMNYYKGLDVVLKALRYNRAKSIANVCKILIAGANTDRMARKLSDKLRCSFSEDVIRIDRALSEDEKVYLLQNCSAFLFPSNKPTEAFGIVQLEAMAAGAPVINFDLPSGVPLVSLDQVTGFTFPVDDFVSIARVIANEKNQIQKLKDLKASIPLHLKRHFSRELIETELVEIYGRMTLNGNSRKSGYIKKVKRPLL